MTAIMNRIGDALRCWKHRLVGHRRQSSFWETRFDELAIFNSEADRGILHTPEKRERMEKLQAAYNAKMMANEKAHLPAPAGKVERNQKEQ